MRQNLLIMALSLISFSNHAQSNNLSVDVNYPITIDNNFVGENLSGIIGLGIDYYFLDFTPVKVGFSLNGSLLGENNETGQENITLTILQPRITTELELTSNGKIRSYFGIGYSFLFFKAPTTRGFANEPEAETNNALADNGLNLNLGLSFSFTQRIFAKAQYDYIFVPAEGVADINYNKRINIVKIGVGYQF